MKVFSFKRFLLVASISFGTIALFGAIGHFIGTRLDRPTLGLIAGVLLSYPVTQYLVYRYSRRHAKAVLNTNTDPVK